MSPGVTSEPLPDKRTAQRAAFWMLVICLTEAMPALAQATPSLLAGTYLGARLDRRLSSKTAHVGDKVEALTVRPVADHKQIILPAGTRLRGAVEAVRAADRPHAIPARLKLVFTEMILPDGRTVPTKVSLEQSRLGGGIWGPPLGGLMAGAFLGALVGSGRGALGAEIGAAVGGGAGMLSMIPVTRGRWREIELSDSRTSLLRLEDDLTLPPASSSTKP